jgi:hypothetical protein
MKNKNKELLKEFSAYCKTHPNERFWQALRSWSEWHFVCVKNQPFEIFQDTYYWEGKNG